MRGPAYGIRGSWLFVLYKEVNLSGKAVTNAGS